MAVVRKGHNMEEFLEILRHEKVRELIEETSRFYYTSPATTVDLGLPIAVTGLFLVGEILRGTKYNLNQLDLFSSGRNDPDLHPCDEKSRLPAAPPSAPS